MVTNDQECIARSQANSSLNTINIASDTYFSLLASVLDATFFCALIHQSIALKTLRILRNYKLYHQMILYGFDIILAMLNIYRIVHSGPVGVNNLSTIWLLNEGVKFLIIIKFGLDIKEMLDSMTTSSMNKHNTNSGQKESYDIEMPHLNTNGYNSASMPLRHPRSY